jgi:hypothetical protein
MSFCVNVRDASFQVGHRQALAAEAAKLADLPQTEMGRSNDLELPNRNRADPDVRQFFRIRLAHLQAILSTVTIVRD